ncbi:MAG: EndoU domain-containing protein [Clostridia bacterium]|nr:EndoU domain-containing protein [Clostridia bacterium]
MFKLFNLFKVTKKEIKHSSRGVFKYKNRKPVKMIKGGHGQSNIKYLLKNKLPFKINQTFSTGVRGGQIFCHKRKNEHKENGHVWFPKSWTDKTIKNAGLHVANLKRNKNVGNHEYMKGKFKGVDVIATKHGRKITGIFPNKDIIDKEK